MLGFKCAFVCALLCFCSEALTQQPGPLPKTIEDILAQLKSMKPDEAIRAQAAELLRSEPPSNASRADLVNYYFKRSHANRTLGSVAQMLADAREAAELARGTSPELERDALVELSDAELWGGNYLNARKARERQSALGGLSYLEGGSAMVAIVSANVGDLKTAESALATAARALASLRSEKSWFTWGSDFNAVYERANANVLRARGKYEEAENAQRDAIVHTDVSIETNRRLQYGGPAQALQSSRSAPFFEARREELEVELASLLGEQGRLQEAEWHARSVLQRTLKRVSGASPEIVNRLSPLIEVLYLEGRFHESRSLASVAREMLEQSGAQPVARGFSVLFSAEGRSLVALGDYRGALERYNQIRASLISDPALQQIYGRGDANWALALLRSGKVSEAAEMLNALLRNALIWMGPEHLQTGIIQGELGMALAAQGDRAAALAQFEPAMKPLLDAQNLNAAPPAVLARIGMIVEAYIGLLREIHRSGEKGPGGLDAAAEAFRLADAIRGRSVQGALAASAARAAATTLALGDLARKEQDLRREATLLYGVLNFQFSLAPDQQLPEVIATTRARISAISDEQRNLATKMQKEFPAYARLIQPRPATVEEARKALAPGEVLLSVLVTPTASYVWAIPKSGTMAFATSRLTGEDINALVGSLRKSLDPGDTRLDAVPPFDFAAGHRIYSELLASVEAGWHGAKNLIVVVNGALAQLPFALLPTQSVKLVPDKQVLFGEFKDVPWLVRLVAITQLPSVNSLVTLRALPQTMTERSAFVGFGDPLFSRSQVVPPQAAGGGQLRKIAIARPPQEGTEAQLSSGRVLRSDVDSATWVSYERLNPLPDTREEILAIAQALKADPQRDVFFGAAASRQTVMSLDLTQRRVIVFATHGLLSGDLPNLSQPALALAAPSDPKESPLLTLEDILSLKLNADWVVLSACNTAAGDGAGAEAISGLGRGFFYAGSRALLVTNWAVETTSARKLTTTLFQRQAADPSLSRAEALRQSMLELIDGPGYVDSATGKVVASYAHPLFWAPFSLVGDGASSTH
jgi:CHAT domain-containing protein